MVGSGRWAVGGGLTRAIKMSSQVLTQHIHPGGRSHLFSGEGRVRIEADLGEKREWLQSQTQKQGSTVPNPSRVKSYPLALTFIFFTGLEGR